jgi:hypothetical protein
VTCLSSSSAPPPPPPPLFVLLVYFPHAVDSIPQFCPGLSFAHSREAQWEMAVSPFTEAQQQQQLHELNSSAGAGAGTGTGIECATWRSQDLSILSTSQQWPTAGGGQASARLADAEAIAAALGRLHRQRLQRLQAAATKRRHLPGRGARSVLGLVRVAFFAFFVAFLSHFLSHFLSRVFAKFECCVARFKFRIFSLPSHLWFDKSYRLSSRIAMLRLSGSNARSNSGVSWLDDRAAETEASYIRGAT